MTLTKYQRGDQAEGWNDMPLIMMNASQLHSTTPKPRRKATRVAHNLNSSTPYVSYPMLATPPSSHSLPTSSFPSSASLVTPRISSSNSTLLLPPTKPPCHAPVSLSSEQAHVSRLNEFCSPAQVNEVLREFSKESSLTTIEYNACVEMLISLLDSLTVPQLLFCQEILTLAMNNTPQQVRSEVVNYMMLNNGVSSWCIPLRRLVENKVD